MKNVFRRRPAKAISYRSNQWSGPRAVQTRDRRMQARRSAITARLRRVVQVVGWLVVAGVVCWAGLLLVRQVGPILQRSLEIREVSVEGIRQVTKQEVLERLALKKALCQTQTR